MDGLQPKTTNCCWKGIHQLPEKCVAC
uniref:Uncharacterized protein n=1 Tax=Lepeophtheirus salmonis TaxID=72036 RepID=A0A0K2V0C0_LEPSM